MSASHEPLAITTAQRHYDALIGVGGIGTGRFFAMNGNHTLGREESRGGYFLDRRDYCKLHIIAHYVQTLLGPKFGTYPIGKVGDDDEGKGLIAEIQEAGLDLRYIQTVPNGQTLSSFCFVYPDGSGGNLTTDDSVNASVDAAYVQRARPTFAAFAKRGIALAVPEVPLEARLKLVELGSANGFFCVAALTTEEITSALAYPILHKTDLVALNLDEAAAIGCVEADQEQPLSVVQAAINNLNKIKSDSWIAITAGSKGSWTWDGDFLNHCSAIKTNMASTAGAGDAFLAGTLVGLTANLTLAQAQELGTLVAGLSVTSPHTIHPGIDRCTLKAFADEHQVPVSNIVSKLLQATVLETRV
jgi:ribokinase